MFNISPDDLCDIKEEIEVVAQQLADFLHEKDVKNGSAIMALQLVFAICLREVTSWDQYCKIMDTMKKEHKLLWDK